LDPDLVDSNVAEQNAKAFARAEQSKLDSRKVTGLMHVKRHPPHMSQLSGRANLKPSLARTRLCPSCPQPQGGAVLPALMQIKARPCTCPIHETGQRTMSLLRGPDTARLVQLRGRGRAPKGTSLRFGAVI